MGPKQDLDSALAALVDLLRRPDESIWECLESNGEVSVRLIEKRKIPQAQAFESLFGLSGGEGRALQFGRVQGKWQLISESRWIA